MIELMTTQVENELFETLRALEPSYVRDDYASQLAGILRDITKDWRDITVFAQTIAEEMVLDVDQKNRDRSG